MRLFFREAVIDMLEGEGVEYGIKVYYVISYVHLSNAYHRGATIVLECFESHYRTASVPIGEGTQ